MKYFWVMFKRNLAISAFHVSQAEEGQTINSLCRLIGLWMVAAEYEVNVTT